MHTDFDKEMKALEVYSGIQVPPECWTILRIDGRHFSTTTKNLGFKKPFDQTFHSWMGTATQVLVNDLQAVLGYHQSDEISILLPRAHNLFDREVMKLVSVSAGLASSAFSRCIPDYADTPEYDFPHFDSRVIVAATNQQVLRYFNWRMQDAVRNALNSYCHWTAIQKDGMTNTQAAAVFKEKPQSFKNEFLFKRDINFNEVPGWQKRGTFYFWEQYKKEGFNPKTQEKTLVDRRRLQSGEAAQGETFFGFVEKVLNG
jgi:tRNA(His) guanylyltransferase